MSSFHFVLPNQMWERQEEEAKSYHSYLFNEPFNIFVDIVSRKMASNNHKTVINIIIFWWMFDREIHIASNAVQCIQLRHTLK